MKEKEVESGRVGPEPKSRTLNCSHCGAYMLSICVYCPACRTRNSRFSNAEFQKRRHASLSEEKERICEKGHQPMREGLRQDLGLGLFVQAYPFCPLCGEDPRLLISE